MKKMRFVALLAVMMATVMLLSSCWFSGVSVKKWIDDEASFKTTPVLSAMTEAPGLPDGAWLVDSAQNLAYFRAITADSADDIHIVYDIVENKIVKKVTENDLVDYEVTLATAWVGDDDVAYFYITETTDSGTKTELYDVTGNAVASQNNCPAPEDTCDLVYFDGAYYRLKKNGTLSKAFSWSALAMRPYPDVKYGEYYYALDNEMIVVYDTSLQIVSSYEMPVNALAVGMTNTTILENGNMLVQYLVPEPDDAKKYSFTVIGANAGGMTMMKVTLETVLIKAKNGKAKSINCDYFFVDDVICEAFDADELEGLKPSCLAWGVEFDKDTVLNLASLDEELLTLVSINKKGKVKALKQFENEKVTYIEMVAKNRWVVETATGHEYLIDESAEVLGDIASAYNYHETFFMGDDGKVYNWSIKEQYNFRAQKQTVYNYMNNAIVFRGEEGEYTLYYDGKTSTIVAAGSRTQSLDRVASNYYVIRNTESLETSYTFYNEAGAELKTLRRSYSQVYSFEDYVLIKTTNSDNEDIYYRISK